ncbi:MAG: VPLPA-CTERM sorting domain-containing protein, partial [Rhodospirillales bacterium]
AASSAAVLDLQGGSLNLGVHDFTVSGDYRNAAFGEGNAFDARANVSGTGSILATGDVRQGIGGDAIDGDTATAVLDFQDVRVGTAETRSFTVRNDGSDGPALRGALQTAAGTGSITTADLSGPGVTAQNFGALAPGGETGAYGVTFAPTAPGTLTGQSVGIVNNFANVDGQTLVFEGRGIEAAGGALATLNLDFGVVRVGDPAPTLTVAVSNTAAAGPLAESLGIGVGTASGGFTAADTDPGVAIAAGSTAPDRINVTLDTAAAGIRDGSVAVAYTTLPIAGSSLAEASVGSDTLVMTGQVNNLANPGFAFGGGGGLFQGLGGGRYVLDFGEVNITGGPVTASLLVTNEFVFVGAPQDDLGGSFTFGGDAVFATLGFDAFADLAAGGSLGGFQVTLDPAAAGLGTYSSFIGLLGLSTFAGLPDLTPAELELALGYLPELELKVVVTPLPASVWFLGSALVALGAAARRRRAQAQAQGNAA